jgi:hypothetical protein
VGPFKNKEYMLNGTHGGRGRVCETDVARVRVGQGIAGQNYCVLKEFGLWHSLQV